MPTTTYTTPTMAAATIGARTDAAGAAVVDLTAEEARLSMGMFASGYVAPNNSFIVRAQTSPNMSVRVGSDTAKTDIYVINGTGSGQGTYIVRLDQAAQSITIDAADASQTRIDDIYLVVRDNPYDSSARALPQIAYRKGDAGAGAPAVDASWRAATRIGRVTVTAGSTSIQTSAIADSRVPTSMVGDVGAQYLLSALYKTGTKGRFLVADGAGTTSGAPTFQSPGADGSFLISDSSASTGLAWSTLNVPQTIFTTGQNTRTATTMTPIVNVSSGGTSGQMTFTLAGVSSYTVEARLVVFAEPGTRIKLAVGASPGVVSRTAFEGLPTATNSDTVGSRDYSVELHTGASASVVIGRGGGARNEVIVRSFVSNSNSGTALWGLQFGTEASGLVSTIDNGSFLIYTRVA